MKKRICALFLALALVLVSAALGERESFTISSQSYPVPNPMNAWQQLGDSARFNLIELGEIDAGSLRGSAYTIRYIGSDEEFESKVKESPYIIIHQQYVSLENRLGIEIENRTVSVNGTEAELYTYPNGGRVLYAAFLPDTEPLMLIESNCGLILDEAVEKESDFVIPEISPTATPAPKPSSKPKAYPPAFGKSGTIGFMGQTLVTYNYSGTSSDVANYIMALTDAGYKMIEQKVDDSSITMTFRNDEEDIELEIYQILSSFSSTSTILITYFYVCPSGDIIDGKIVKKSSFSSESSGAATAKATKSSSAAPVAAAPNVSFRCMYCNDTKICPVCYGRRRYYISGYGVGQGSYVNCSGCNGMGRCSYCQ